MTDDVRDWWEATAEEFQDAADLDVAVRWAQLYREDLRLLGDVEGLDVLELGCGGGQCSVALAERGADVTGVDLSAAQLDHARRLAAAHGVDVEFIRGDVTDLPVEDERFDAAFNAYVFQWVPDVEAAIAEAYRVLRPGGRLAFTTPHPFDKVVDPESHEVTESYFDTGRHVIADDSRDADLVTFRNTVADYVNALVAAGFELERMHEPGSTDPEDYEPGPWGEHPPELLAKVPDVLGFEARKPERSGAEAVVQR